jgi:putative glutamine amidotransferase
VVTAQAEDGEIESIKHSALQWEGWMWHPERETPFNPIDIDRLKALFK